MLTRAHLVVAEGCSSYTPTTTSGREARIAIFRRACDLLGTPSCGSRDRSKVGILPKILTREGLRLWFRRFCHRSPDEDMAEAHSPGCSTTAFFRDAGQVDQRVQLQYQYGTRAQKLLGPDQFHTATLTGPSGLYGKSTAKHSTVHRDKRHLVTKRL